MCSPRADACHTVDITTRPPPHKRLSSAAGRGRSQHHPCMAWACQSGHHQHLRGNRSPDEGESDGVMRCRGPRPKPTLERGQECGRVPEFNLTGGKLCCGSHGRNASSGLRQGLRNIIRCATFYRQSEIYAREGVELDRSTLGDWVGQAAWLLDPVVAKIRQHVFAAEKIHGDDTTVPVLAPGLGRTATGRLWVYVRDDRLCGGPAAPAAAYFYSPDRGAEHPTAHMASFTGFLQADGYAGFDGLYNPARTKPGPIAEVACWAHCRRKFFDVWEATKSPVAKEALDRIAAVYAIEDKARFAPADGRVEQRRGQT